MVIQSRLDWYSGSLDLSTYEEVDELVKLLADYVGSKSFQYEKGFYRGKLWINSWSDSAFSFLVGSNYDKDDDCFHTFVELRGSFLSQFSYSHQLELDRYFLERCFNPTRIDVCLDDYDRRVSFDEVCQIGLRGDFYPYEKFKLIETASRDFVGRSAKTCYFGSAAKSVRFYDAQVVHDIPADRWEFQLRDQFAKQCLVQLRSGDFPSSIVLGSIIFLDLEGWESLKSEVASLSFVSGSSFDFNLPKTLSWLESQVSSSLAMISDCYSDYFPIYLEYLLSLGRSRYKNYHRSVISSYRQHLQLKELSTNA